MTRREMMMMKKRRETVKRKVMMIQKWTKRKKKYKNSLRPSKAATLWTRPGPKVTPLMDPRINVQFVYANSKLKSWATPSLAIIASVSNAYWSGPIMSTLAPSIDWSSTKYSPVKLRMEKSPTPFHARTKRLKRARMSPKKIRRFAKFAADAIERIDSCSATVAITASI